MFYKCRHFAIDELVDQATFRRFGELAWQFFRPEILISIDGIRDYYSRPIIVNNWHDGGPFSERGLRILNDGDKAIYSPYSAHPMGAAVDLDVEGVPAEEVRQTILAHKDEDAFKLINRLEKGTNWVHADVFNVENRIVVFSG
jgi:hypothetical protein